MYALVRLTAFHHDIRAVDGRSHAAPKTQRHAGPSSGRASLGRPATRLAMKRLTGHPLTPPNRKWKPLWELSGRTPPRARENSPLFDWYEFPAEHSFVDGEDTDEKDMRDSDTDESEAQRKGQCNTDEDDEYDEANNPTEPSGDKVSDVEKTSGEESSEHEYRTKDGASANQDGSDSEGSARSVLRPLPVRAVPAQWRHATLDCAPGSLRVYDPGCYALTFVNRP